MEGGMQMMDQAVRSGFELFRKGVEASHAMVEMQARTQDLWNASLATWTAQAQAMAQVGSRALDFWTHWTDIARRNMDQLAALAGREARQAGASGASKSS
jgi:hypothetical protein